MQPKRTFGAAALPLAACMLALVFLPLAAKAQGGTAFVFDPSWPANGGKPAPDYPWIDVTGVAVGHDGRVYITQGLPSHNDVLVFDAQGDYSFTFGGDVLQEPHTIRCGPDGTLWVTDFDTHQVTRWSPDGQLVAAYGPRHEPGREPGHFSGPNDVAFAPSGDVYVAEGDGEQVVRLNANGQWKQSWGVKGKKPGQFKFPHSIAVDAQNRVYLADRNGKKICIFTADGQLITEWKQIGHPWSLWITPDQRLFVADGNQGRIFILDLNGTILGSFGHGGRKPGQLREAHMICVDSSTGILYEADAGGKRVQRFLPQ